MKEFFRKYILVLVKGFGMGAADVVPGVSGGTIAFITGIYEELIHSIKSIDIEALKLFFKGKWKSFWEHINGNFLLSLFLGVGLAIFSLAKLLKHLLETEPILLWSFFFGLIIISSVFVAKRIKDWDYTKAVALMSGVAVAVYITSIAPAESSNAGWFIVLSGVLASCAMILPGISGSFILLLLGKYEYALDAIHNLDFVAIFMLGAGAVIGLLSLSKFLSWLLKKYHDVTLALLAGFMIGSLNKIWPWKETPKMIDGLEEPLFQKNVLPSFTDKADQLLMSILMLLAGIAIVLAIELAFGKKKHPNKS